MHKSNPGYFEEEETCIKGPVLKTIQKIQLDKKYEMETRFCEECTLE